VIIRYCGFCGRKLVNVTVEARYDRATGKRLPGEVQTRCPQLDYVRLFPALVENSRHDSYRADVLTQPDGTISTERGWGHTEISESGPRIPTTRR
jgi:hypothetical protein